MRWQNTSFNFTKGWLLSSNVSTNVDGCTVALHLLVTYIYAKLLFAYHSFFRQIGKGFSDIFFHLYPSNISTFFSNLTKDLFIFFHLQSIAILASLDDVLSSTFNNSIPLFYIITLLLTPQKFPNQIFYKVAYFSHVVLVF